ncbi:MAG: class I SAM-dependent methyltransferase [Candidatus Methanomethyliaceae archaeon]
MEYVRCDLCGADNSVPVLERIDRFSGSTFHYVGCRECGLIYLNPRPDATEILAYYPASYESYQALRATKGIELWLQKRAWRILAQFVSQYQTGRKLLDIGCATGEFLREMRARGFEVQGVEFNSFAATIAKDVYGLKVFVGPLAEFIAPESTFDVITMWDVLEHLPSPYNSLQQIHQWLRDGGHLFLSIPNVHSFDAKLFGSWWIGWDAPRHLYAFPEPTLKRLLQDTGFNIVAMRSLMGGQGSFRLSCQFVLDRTIGARVFQPGLSQVVWLLVSALIWPYKEVSYLLNRGPITTIVARKVLRG